VLNVSTKTLQRDETFVQIHKRGMDQGRMSLRRYQWNSAEKGNVTMQIWLGKQYLGQSDKVVVDNQADAIKSATEIVAKVRELAVDSNE